MTALKSRQLKLPRSAHELARTPPKMREIPARRTEDAICRPRIHKLTSLASRHEEHACPSAPLQRRVCHRPVNRPRKVKLALQTCRHGSRMASRTKVKTEPLSRWYRVERVSLSRHDRPGIQAIQLSQLQICAWTCTHTAENEGNSCAADWGARSACRV